MVWIQPMAPASSIVKNNTIIKYAPRVISKWCHNLEHGVYSSIMLLELSIMLPESSIMLLENINRTGITHDDCHMTNIIYNIITLPDWLNEERLDSKRYRYQHLEHTHTFCLHTPSSPVRERERKSEEKEKKGGRERVKKREREREWERERERERGRESEK